MAKRIRPMNTDAAGLKALPFQMMSPRIMILL